MNSRSGYKDFLVTKTYVHEDGETTTTTTDATATQSYNEAKKSGFVGSFTEFLTQLKDSGIIDTIGGLIFQIKGGKTETAKQEPLPKTDESKKILGLSPIVFFGITALVVIGVSFGVMQMFKGKK